MKYDLNDSNNIHTHAKAISKHKKFELVGGVDIDIKNRTLFKEVYNKVTFSSLDKGILYAKPDGIIISSNTESHLINVKSASKYDNIKFILCEKPLGRNLDEAKEIVQICKNRQIKLFVNFVRRSDKGVLKIHKDIILKNINGPFKGCCIYTKGFIHNGSHFFNILELWLGKMKSFKILSSSRKYLNKFQEVDLKITFKNGEIYFIHGFEEKFSYNEIHLICNEGSIQYANGGDLIKWINYSKNGKKEIIRNDMTKYQLNVYNELFLAYNGLKSDICSGTEALSNLSSMYKITKSLK
jgi:predicted dehydrogenase